MCTPRRLHIPARSPRVLTAARVKASLDLPVGYSPATVFSTQVSMVIPTAARHAARQPMVVAAVPTAIRRITIRMPAGAAGAMVALVAGVAIAGTVRSESVVSAALHFQRPLEDSVLVEVVAPGPATIPILTTRQAPEPPAVELSTSEREVSLELQR